MIKYIKKKKPDVLSLFLAVIVALCTAGMAYKLFPGITTRHLVFIGCITFGVCWWVFGCIFRE